MLKSAPLSLYVHLPWCVRKCPYCDFNSFAFQGSFPEAQYVEALQRDLRAQAPAFAGRPIQTIFFGGGTPSLFAPASIGRILETAACELSIAPDAEVTLEANPGTIEHGAFCGYRDAGINRVSLGGQTFAPEQLRRLGRIHLADDTRAAARELHEAGISNFNIDLMYGLPDQTIEDAVRDVEEALALGPAHISHYQLTLEPGTVFAASPPPPPRADAVDQLEACAPVLSRGGFARYEISAYALPGARARHNLNYWQFGDYLGVGAGAHGKRSNAHSGTIVRTVRSREPRRYMAECDAPLETMPIDTRDRPFEFMLNAMRLVEGFQQGLFEARTGLEWSSISPLMEELRYEGLAVSEGESWAPSARGLLFLNDLLIRFIPATRDYSQARGGST